MNGVLKMNNNAKIEVVIKNSKQFISFKLNTTNIMQEKLINLYAECLSIDRAPKKFYLASHKKRYAIYNIKRINISSSVGYKLYTLECENVAEEKEDY